MNSNYLNAFPNWNDNFDDEDDGENWKPNPTKDLCKKLYAKWNEILVVL